MLLGHLCRFFPLLSTQIDLMDKGTHAAKMLNGDEVPLRLGYTGVRNRSQADILEHKTIQDALAVS